MVSAEAGTASIRPAAGTVTVATSVTANLSNTPAKATTCRPVERPERVHRNLP